MKKKILPLFLLPAVLTYAQPKLVGTLEFNGPAEGGSIFRLDRPGTAPGVIYTFNNLAPHLPAGAVSAGDADRLYGTLKYNGTNSKGGFYRINKDGTGFTMLYSLDNAPGADMIPYYHTDGMIYFSNEFEIKKFDPSTNAITTLPLNSGIYVRNLLIDANDWMYFMTELNTLAKVQTDGTQWTELHSFNAPTEGSNGVAGVTEVPGDTLFGVQTYGGTSDEGTLYSIKKDGTGFIVHHQFTTATGINPESKLVLFDGKLYGTTTQGGDFGYGVLYTINTDGTGYRVLYHFEPGSFGPGETPSGNIAISSNGRIFGAFNQFVVIGFDYYRFFKVDTSGQNFSPFFLVDQRRHGHSNTGVLLADDETIFLTTREMGRHDGGVLSETDTSGSANPLHHFGYAPLGFKPSGALIKASNNKLYGTTIIGGVDGNGVVFSVETNGTAYTKLHEFTDAEGYEPSGKLLEASDGKLYGACKSGRLTGAGCLYRVDKTGSNFQVIYTFPDLAEGYAPVGSLVEDAAGKLYGVTYYTFPGYGTIFRINKDGSGYTVLRTFPNNTDPATPSNGLTLSGSYLYGSASYGGATNSGGIFRIRTDGTGYEDLHLFTGADGATPIATPIVAIDGKVYGTTYMGGANNSGVIYRMDATGSNFTILKNFSSATDGAYPWSGVMQASDGLLYGSIIANVVGRSAVYSIALNGTGYIELKDFDFSTEGYLPSPLTDLSPGVVLPVDLLTFDAIKQEKVVLLKWQTASEQNSKQFEIERSTDGNLFHSIGTVNARGNSSAVAAYAFTDANPLAGKNYYRLKQVDLDGRFEYSMVRSVVFDSKKAFSVFPNPVADVLHVQFSQLFKNARIQIINGEGKMLMTAIMNDAWSYDLPVSSLPGGIYTVRLVTERHRESVSFVKK